MIKNLGSDNTLKLFKFIVEASKLNGHKVIYFSKRECD